jgi:hypothetical protein
MHVSKASNQKKSSHLLKLRTLITSTSFGTNMYRTSQRPGNLQYFNTSAWPDDKSTSLAPLPFPINAVNLVLSIDMITPRELSIFIGVLARPELPDPPIRENLAEGIAENRRMGRPEDVRGHGEAGEVIGRMMQMRG